MGVCGERFAEQERSYAALRATTGQSVEACGLERGQAETLCCEVQAEARPTCR